MSEILALWEEINFEPQYQRLADLWSEERRQLFVDSLINGFDIPKLYFHDLSRGSKLSPGRYAIIDGKQRLRAIKSFVDGEFPLSDEFQDVEQSEPETASRAAGMTYTDLARRVPNLKARLDSARLPIILIQTEDRELIEEMFSRLNEALPLNAPEKRNALRGPLPPHIRSLARSEFFTRHVAYSNGRYRHMDLATKFLYIEHKRGLTDLKRRHLDEFVKSFRRMRMVRKARELHERCTLILDEMNRVFDKQPDPLLQSVGMITVYYCLFRDAFGQSWLRKIDRRTLEAFDKARTENRETLKRINELVLENRRVPPNLQSNPVLAAFERYVQSPNDFTALQQRYRILRHFIETGTISAADSTG